MKNKVLILPMRNGNLVQAMASPVQKFSSYPTYEEWKRLSGFENIVFHVEVLILPMRNGNLVSIKLILLLI